MNPHMEEWKQVKEYFQYMIDNNFTKETTKEQFQFRIECIDDLLEQEKDKEMNHFR